LIAEGRLKPHRIEVKKGGLVGVLAGIDELRTGSVKGSVTYYSALSNEVKYVIIFYRTK